MMKNGLKPLTTPLEANRRDMVEAKNLGLKLATWQNVPSGKALVEYDRTFQWLTVGDGYDTAQTHMLWWIWGG